MGKAKTRRLSKPHQKPRQHPYKPTKGQPSPSAKPTPTTSNPKPHRQPAQEAPTIPFSPHDRILLVGEGDLSFAHSIVSHHGAASVTATTFDTHADLLAKHPQAASHIAYLLSTSQTILHDVDATKLALKTLRKGLPWDRIIFNFPHVGGKSTDVNRQVRYNQELLVSFFRVAAPLLTPETGAIVVTLFEGEPYTLWNIRDLARHVGLKVGRSFRFQWDAYPGYAHARTLGNIEGGGGWKGEGRSARSYVLEAAGEESEKSAKQKKRKEREESESDD